MQTLGEKIFDEVKLLRYIRNTMQIKKNIKRNKQLS